MIGYIPVPVKAAQAIAEEFAKQAVVILAYDSEHELTHTTTYGTTAFFKENAAAAGELCTKAIGGDLSKTQVFEDFHKNYDAAKFRELSEAVVRVVAILDNQSRNPVPNVMVLRQCAADLRRAI